MPTVGERDGEAIEGRGVASARVEELVHSGYVVDDEPPRHAEAQPEDSAPIYVEREQLPATARRGEGRADKEGFEARRAGCATYEPFVPRVDGGDGAAEGALCDAAVRLDLDQLRHGWMLPPRRRGTVSLVTDLAWEVHGDGGPAIVWGHGLTGSRQAENDSGLFDFAPAAVAAGWRYVRYDARGHGRSPKPHSGVAYQWDCLAADMLAVADAAEAETFCAGGASMGAASALYAALAIPQRVDSLVLAIPPTAWETRAGQSDLYRSMAAIVEQRGVERLLTAMEQEPPRTMFGEEGKARTIRNVEAMDCTALPYVFRGAGVSDLPDPAELRELAVPALILCWSGDDGHPVSTGERLEELLPNATLHVAVSPEDVSTWPSRVGDFLKSLLQ